RPPGFSPFRGKFH
nr:bradykininyl-Gly-Lys-Phe-His [Bombina orientalis]prf//730327C kinin O [Bombina orientalis]